MGADDNDDEDDNAGHWYDLGRAGKEPDNLWYTQKVR